MRAITPERVTQLAAKATRRYARACWWADPQDLKQGAELAALEALCTFDADVGAAPEQYVWKAIVLALKRQLWLDSTPATGGTKHRPEEAAKGLTRYVPPPDVTGGTASGEGTPGLEDATAALGMSGEADIFALRGVVQAAHTNEAVWAPPAVDRLYEDQEWLARVQARLTGLAAEATGPGSANTLAVVLGEASAAEVAEVRGVKKQAVYAQSSALRGHIGADETLYALMRERREA